MKKNYSKYFHSLLQWLKSCHTSYIFSNLCCYNCDESLIQIDQLITYSVQYINKHRNIYFSILNELLLNHMIFMITYMKRQWAPSWSVLGLRWIPTNLAMSSQRPLCIFDSVDETMMQGSRKCGCSGCSCTHTFFRKVVLHSQKFFEISN